jgi:hypothetical protein
LWLPSTRRPARWTSSAANQRQVQNPARAGRIPVPVISIPDSFDIPCPFTRAPPERVSALLEVYLDAESASADARAAIAEVAEALDAPSRVLVAAARITDHRPQRSEPDRTWARHLAAIHHPEAGPTERLLRDLNIGDAEMLERAAEIDRASDQLVLKACEQHETTHPERLVRDLCGSTGSAARVNRAIAVARPQVARDGAPDAATARTGLSWNADSARCSRTPNVTLRVAILAPARRRRSRNLTVKGVSRSHD